MFIDRPTHEDINLIDWNTIVPTATTAGSSTTLATITFTGTYQDTIKFCRSLIRCNTAMMNVTASSDTGLKFDKGSAHGRKDGDIVYLSGTTLPTGVVESRPYYMVSTTANTFKIALIPGDTAIPYTDAGTDVICSFITHGYVDSATISGTDVTLNVSLDYDLTATYTDHTNYQVTRIRKIYDFQEYIHTGYVEIGADTVNAQGRLIMDIKRPMYLQSVNSCVAIVATGASPSVQWWIGTGVANANPNTNLFASKTAQDITTVNAVNHRRPTIKYIPSGNNIGLFIEASTGATTKAKGFQSQMFLVPIDVISL